MRDRGGRPTNGWGRGRTGGRGRWDLVCLVGVCASNHDRDATDCTQLSCCWFDYDLLTIADKYGTGVATAEGQTDCWRVKIYRVAHKSMCKDLQGLLRISFCKSIKMIDFK